MPRECWGLASPPGYPQKPLNKDVVVTNTKSFDEGQPLLRQQWFAAERSSDSWEFLLMLLLVYGPSFHINIHRHPELCLYVRLNPFPTVCKALVYTLSDPCPFLVKGDNHFLPQDCTSPSTATLDSVTPLVPVLPVPYRQGWWWDKNRKWDFLKGL